MKNLVIASFPAAENKMDELKAMFERELVTTRSFEGCISIDVYQQQDEETIHLVEDWETMDHYEKYLQWRIDNGLPEMLEPLLKGGSDALEIFRCAEKTNI